LNWLLLLGSAYLTADCDRVFCGDLLANGPAGSTSAAQSTPMGLTKRPVTVADSIQMSRLGDPTYTDGASSKGKVARFSPDGQNFVVVLKKGNLESNTNDYSLLLFQTSRVFQSPEPRVLVSLASSSNRPAINDVFWLDDNDTILFLGESPGEQTQLYSLKCSSRQVTILTRSPTSLTSFVATGSGNVIVYTARNQVSTFLTDSVSRQGIAVNDEFVTDLIRGTYGGGDYDDHSLFVKRKGNDSGTKIAIQGRIGGDYPEASLSLDGSHLLIKTEAAHVSPTWSEYEDQFLKVATRHPAPNGGHTNVLQYELVDTVTGASEVLIDTPIPSLGSEMASSPDSKSFVVSDVYLPLNIGDVGEKALRRARAFLVEFKIPSREFAKVSQDDLRLVNWDPKTGYVTCEIGRIDSLNGKDTRKAYFRKSGEVWSKTSAPNQVGEASLPNIILDEDMNTAPRILAVDPSSGRKSLLMDLNPQFRDLALARVEEISWKDTRGNEVKGGLYWPPDYVTGKRYPVVIQTHGWRSDRFWMDGPWPTAVAAQALAGEDFFVLQAPDPDWHIWDTAKEAPGATAVYDGAIGYLDRRGLIDPNRVGIIGFSRTYWYVAYTLIHSKYHFASAALADGVSFSYFQYMAFLSGAGEFEQMYGGPPYGRSLAHWLRQSPSFHMDKIETPLRVQALYPNSLLSDWDWYTGLRRLGKPVEMIYIPQGTHILEKPWDRISSQEGNVDWFCFWLMSKEDSDPRKVEQYRRWRELRNLQGRPTSSINSR
jgi:hypothetical protein